MRRFVTILLPPPFPELLLRLKNTTISVALFECATDSIEIHGLNFRNSLSLTSSPEDMSA